MAAGLFDGEFHDLFREARSGHDCTDCALDVPDAATLSAAAGVRCDLVGGGSIVRDADRPLTELHVVPHGGVELPADLLEETGPASFAELARLVHDNLDSATRVMHAALVALIVRRELRGAAVAGFHLSRILVDANRLLSTDQVLRAPYVGSPDLYSGYLAENRERLSREYAGPWIDAVNDLLGDNPGCVVYHHHTYDVRSLRPRVHDLGRPGRLRPPFQLFHARPSLEATPRDDEGLVPHETLTKVRASIGAFLAELTGTRPVDGAVDYPLRAPALPFTGCVNDGLDRRYVHLIYEVRKDLLRSRADIERWIAARPWAVM